MAMMAQGYLDDPALFLPSVSDDGRKPQPKPPPLTLAAEYLDLADAHSVSIKCAVFHVRRMCKDELTRCAD
jgi:hypothetical protein